MEPETTVTTRDRWLYRLGHEDGVITHFHTFGPDSEFDRWVERYRQTAQEIRGRGLDVPAELLARW